jgi:hypothetical protein
MKTVVSVQEVEELALKPPEQLAEWRRLLEQHLSEVLAAESSVGLVGCPCCGDEKTGAGFERMGIPYDECRTCGTLFANRRPGPGAVRLWYRDSAPARYWREVLLPASASARDDQVVAPRAQWVADGIAEYVPGASSVLDVSANSASLLRILGEMVPGLSMVAAGVAADLDGHEPGVRVAPMGARSWADQAPADLVIAIDAFDRAPDLRDFVLRLREALRPGGVVFATLPVASGFEIQTLWDRSPTILPPDKVNLPTIAGLRRLFPSGEWELLELSTPGMFDVEVVRRTLAATPEGPWPRAVRALVTDLDSAGQVAFTEFLQSQRLSSFARLVARRTS